MNKNRKSKLVLFSVIGLAAVSIGTVGFATWVVGVQRTEVGLQLSAKVDDTQNKSIMLEATIDNTYQFKVAEKVEHNTIKDNDLVVTGDTGEHSIVFDPNAMTFKFSTLQFSCGDAAERPSKLILSLATGASINTFNTVVKEDNKLPSERSGTSWTYLALQYELNLSYEGKGGTPNVTAQQKADGASFTTYKINQTVFEMHWGTFFGNQTYKSNVSPLNYYNNISNKKQGDKYVYDEANELFTLADNIHSEISKMNTVLNNSSNKLDILVKVE